jgi:hypothetical protein
MAEPWKDAVFELMEKSTAGKRSFEDAIALKERFLPAKVYKYRFDNNCARQNLKDDTVWLASPSTFNDPYDCEFTVAQMTLKPRFKVGF